MTMIPTAPNPPAPEEGQDRGFTLRWAIPDDADDLAALQAASRAASPGHEAWCVSDWRTLLGQPGILAILAGAPVGVPAMAEPGVGDGTPGHFGFALIRTVLDEAELYAIGVVEDRRRLGIATAMLQRASESAAFLGARTLFLEVAQSNVPARTFYESRGFRIVGKRAGYYRGVSGSEPALIMSCELSAGIVVHRGPAM